MATIKCTFCNNKIGENRENALNKKTEQLDLYIREYKTDNTSKQLDAHVSLCDKHYKDFLESAGVKQEVKEAL